MRGGRLLYLWEVWVSMSRKHVPIWGIAGGSDKQDKRKANRALRRLVRESLGAGRDVLPVMREVSDVWVWSKDGKCYWRPDKWWDERPWEVWGK